MKKIYLSILSVALVSGLSAQVKQQDGPVARSNDRSEAKMNINSTNIVKSVPLWSNTFGTPADWVIAHDATACSLDWQIGTVSCAGSFAIPDIASSTAADGWAMVDSDAYGGAAGGTEVEDSWITTAAPITSLVGYPNVVVEFETYYRRYNSERPYLVIGVGDGTGPGSVVWPDLDPLTNISAMPNVFDIFPNWPNVTSSDNPQVMQISISNALVGLSPTQLADLYIRFHWTGTWGYAWFVDNVNVIEQPADDIQTTSAWIVGENNGGSEYGRNPIEQLDVNWTVGAEIFNFGINDQTNVTLTADFVSFSSGGSVPLLENDSTVIIENIISPSLPAGVYNGTYTAVSDQEMGGASFGNNVYTRAFEVTQGPNEIYSLDGVGVYSPSDQKLTSLGTNSFIVQNPSSADGLIIAAMYHIKQTAQVAGIRAMLASGTQVGGEVYGSIKDTTTFLAEDLTSLFATPVGVVTAADTTNGYIDVYFNSAVTLIPGEYYAAVELFSNGNANDIRVLDDITVAQPGFASMVYIPGSGVSGNGTASGVRMLMGASSEWGVGIDENTLTGVSVYPNPSEGIVNITNVSGTSNTIEIHNMLGQEILTKVSNSNTTVDLSANGAGVYLVKVSNENGSLVERVVIK